MSNVYKCVCMYLCYGNFNILPGSFRMISASMLLDGDGKKLTIDVAILKMFSFINIIIS